MENIKSYEAYLNEAKVQEKEGISPAIYKDLKQYFKETKNPSFKGAQEYISDKRSDKKDGWDLSEEDFDEAKKMFSK